MDFINNTSNKDLTIVPFNMALMDSLWNFYNYEEPDISMAARTVDNFAFYGDIKEKWGGNEDTERIITDAEKEERIELFQNSIPYFRCFGFCPLRTGIKPDGTKYPIIPVYGLGKYALAIDNNTQQQSILYAPRHKYMSYNSNTWNNIDDFSTQFTFTINEVDPTVQVYVWAGKDPDISGKRFKSQMFQLYKEYLRIEELDEDTLEIEYKNARRETFVERAELKIPDLMTETDITIDNPRSSAEGIQTYKIRKEDSDRNEDFVKRQRYERDKAVSSDLNNTRRKQIGNNMITIPSRRKMASDLLFFLEPGRTVKDIQSSRSYPDLLRRKEMFRETVFNTIGLPISFMGSKSGAKNIPGVTHEEIVLKNEVNTIRITCCNFYKFVYNSMYRGEDDKDLAWDYYNMLNSMFKGNEFDFFDAANLPSPFVNTQERISTILDKASIRQFNKSDPKRRKGRRSKREEDEFYTIIDTVKFKRNDIEVKKSYEERYNKILDVASLKDRVEMRFDSDPFESKHLIQEIFQAAQEGCITKSEKVSLIRSKFRLPQNEISEIEKDLDESYNNKAKGIDDPARDTNTKVNESNKIDEIVISEKKNEINSNESTKKKRKTKTKNETESDGNPVKKKRK